MIESMLFFLTTIAVLILIAGVYLRNAIIFGVGGVVLLGIGAYLLFANDSVQTPYIDTIKGSTDGFDYNVNYLSLDTENDNLINILANLFFYGGFVLATLSIAFVYITKHRKNEALESDMEE